jgi:hypothetical protein
MKKKPNNDEYFNFHPPNKIMLREVKIRKSKKPPLFKEWDI